MPTLSFPNSVTRALGKPFAPTLLMPKPVPYGFGGRTLETLLYS